MRRAFSKDPLWRHVSGNVHHIQLCIYAAVEDKKESNFISIFLRFFETYKMTMTTSRKTKMCLFDFRDL